MGLGQLVLLLQSNFHQVEEERLVEGHTLAYNILVVEVAGMVVKVAGMLVEVADMPVEELASNKAAAEVEPGERPVVGLAAAAVVVHYSQRYAHFLHLVYLHILGVIYAI